MDEGSHDGRIDAARQAANDAATADLIADLNRALDEFAQQAASGTIRGEGTPAIAMVDENGQPVSDGTRVHLQAQGGRVFPPTAETDGGLVFARLPIRALDIVEVAPPLDNADVTSFAAAKVIYEVLGWMKEKLA